MNRVIVLLSLFLICSCAPQQIVKEEEPLVPPPPGVSKIPTEIGIPTQAIGRPVFPAKKPVTPLFGKLLSEVTTSSSSFNPNHGEDVAIYFHLSEPGKVTATVYDPDHGLIKVLADEDTMESGEQVYRLDGC